MPPALKSGAGRRSDGSGYKLAKAGTQDPHSSAGTGAASVPGAVFKQIAGVRTDVQVKILAEGEELASDCRELQLTDCGISGIPVFQVAGSPPGPFEKSRVTAVIDFCPDMGKKETGRFLRERKASGRAERGKL